jgi:hypothetical protein
MPWEEGGVSYTEHQESSDEPFIPIKWQDKDTKRNSI